MNKTIFPLGNDLKIVKILNEFIPSDKFIDINPYDLTKEQIESLDLYISYTFENLSYTDFKKVAFEFDSIVDDMNQYDLILAPGDSPAKYINAIQLIGLKTPPIILFPASSIDTDPNVRTINRVFFPGGKTDKKQLDNYLSHLLKDYPNIKSIGIFDLMGYGRSYNSISDSLYRIFPNIEIGQVKFPNITWLYNVLTFSEKSGSRCVLKYEISDEYPKSKTVSDTFRCNVISLALTYLKILNDLSKEEVFDDVQLSIEEFCKNISVTIYNLSKHIYNCTWYNIKTNEIMTGFIELNWEGSAEVFKFKSISGKFSKYGNPTITKKFNINTIISIDDPIIFNTPKEWKDHLLLLTLFNNENIFAIKDKYDDYISVGNRVNENEIYDEYKVIKTPFGIFNKNYRISNTYIISGIKISI